jgi:hypothetical protein
MVSVYYSIELTFGTPLINAQTASQSTWSTPLLLSKFILFGTSIDFSDYDSRRVAITYIQKLRVPQFFYTYPFDPTEYPLEPPFPQTRFPGYGTYVLLDDLSWQTALQDLSIALSYRDSDGPIGPPQTAFLAALASLDSLFDSRSSFYDRFTFELSYAILWAPYPPPP